MIRKKIITIILSAFVASASAQSIDSIFYHAPADILPFIDGNSRLDMLDLYNCGMKAEAVNDQMGLVLLEEKDSLHFLVKTTPSSRMDFRKLPFQKDTIYACIRTVLMPEEYSQVAFFDRSWQPVKIQLPANIDFEHCWSPDADLSEDRVEELRLLLSTMPLHAAWKTKEDGRPVLVYEVSLNGLLENDKNDAAKCLRKLEYFWTDGKFEKIN